MPKFEYYRGSEADQFSFYRIPKHLFICDEFRILSDSAKILYGLLLNRMDLSIKNNWLDKNNNVYIIFPLDEVQKLINCGHDKATKLFNELLEIGLIVRKKQGLGKPSIIYVMNFIGTCENTAVKNAENQQSDVLENRIQDCGKVAGNKTNYNKTNISKNHSINHSISEIINISHDEVTDRKNDFTTEDIIMEVKNNNNAIPYYFSSNVEKMKVIIKKLTKYDELINQFVNEELQGFFLTFRLLINLSTLKKPTKVTDRYVSYSDVIDLINQNINLDENGEPTLYDFIISFIEEFKKIIKEQTFKNTESYIRSCLYTWLAVGKIKEENTLNQLSF